MTYQFMAELVRSLGGRIREIRLDALVSGAYAATVEAEGPHGVELVDARSSDALNLAVLVGAPIVVALEMVEDSDQRQEGESAEAVLMRRALTTPPMTITKAER
jgi:bifunctional DNase/RNase